MGPLFHHYFINADAGNHKPPPRQNPRKTNQRTLGFLHLRALKMRVAQSLSADENAPEWAFSKRKGLKGIF